MTSFYLKYKLLQSATIATSSPSSPRRHCNSLGVVVMRWMVDDFSDLPHYLLWRFCWIFCGPTFRRLTQSNCSNNCQLLVKTQRKILYWTRKIKSVAKYFFYVVEIFYGIILRKDKISNKVLLGDTRYYMGILLEG